MFSNINTYNLLVVLTVALGSFTFGFTVNITGGVFGMPSFYEYFHIDITSTTGVIGGISACYFAGGCIGAVLAAFSDGLGRRKALFITCITGVLGGVLLGAAYHVSMILLGRLLSGTCSGAFLALVPIYQSEISPASHRGSLVGQHGFFLVLGGATAVWATLGCSFAEIPQLQWRLALSLSALPPLVLTPAILWLPESPRWLMLQDRNEQALNVLKSLHDTPEDTEHRLAMEEYIQIRKQLDAEPKVNLIETLRQPSMRKRFLISFLTMFLLQSSGVLVIVTYQVILYNNLGIHGWLAIALLGFYNTWSAVGNFVNALVVDRFGRRKMLFFGLTGAVVCLTIYTALVGRYAGTTNRVGCAFGVLFVYLYTTCYAFCLDATSYVYCAEIFPTHMRTIGMAWSIVSYFAPALLYGQLAPIAFATIAWKYYIVFICVPTCGLPVIWFYFPETKGLTLEEIGGLFGDEVALELASITTQQKEILQEELVDKSVEHLETRA